MSSVNIFTYDDVTMCFCVFITYFELAFDNIEPTEYDTSSSREYKELLQLISRNEEKLLTTMTDSQKDMFSRYQDCVREFQAMTECLLFQNSFHLGARMRLKVMDE